MIGPQLAMFTQEVMSSPFAAALVGELAERQTQSTRLHASLRSASVGSPELWPFHAVPLPVAITETRGATLQDVDGRSYLDLFLGFGTQALHGHNAPRSSRRRGIR